MRQDTKELCEMMDAAVDLIEKNRYAEALLLLVRIEKLLALWVERHLSP